MRLVLLICLLRQICDTKQTVSPCAGSKLELAIHLVAQGGAGEQEQRRLQALCIAGLQPSSGGSVQQRCWHTAAIVSQ